MFFILASAFIGVVSAQVQEVAFSAGLSHDLTLLHAETVVYDTIFTNIGAGYDTNSGNFNCPVSGFYVFEFHMLSHTDKSSWLELYHNAKYICSAYGHTSNDYASGGNAVILKLTKGDQVHIKAVDSQYGYDTILYGQPDDLYATFSGYLVAPVIDEIPAVGK